MHSTISYHLATALIADDHARAERERAARAAKHARHAPQPDHQHPAPGWSARTFTRRALSLLAVRST